MIRTLKIYWDYEDELEVYEISDGMLQASKIIYGVRMYPYIIFDDGRKKILLGILVYFNFYSLSLKIQ